MVPDPSAAASAPENRRFPLESMIVILSVVLLPSAVAIFLAKLSAMPAPSSSLRSSITLA